MAVLLVYQVSVVLRYKCFSADEPIQRSTPALRHPYLRLSHLPRSTTCAELAFLAEQSSKDDIRMPYLIRIAFPSTGHFDPIRGYAISGFANRDTSKILIGQ